MIENIVRFEEQYPEESKVLELMCQIGGEELRMAFESIADPKIGRNELCPCGSGKKYKKCCLET